MVTPGDSSAGSEIGARFGGLASDNKSASNTSRTTVVVLAALVLVLIGGFVVLTATGRDTVSYTVFASGPVMSAIVGALLAQRTSAIAADVKQVVHQTNGQLEGQFKAASDERQAIAANVLDQLPTVPPVVAPAPTA
jgi:hypothetical protein